jgi:hypothetical protein
MAIEVEQQPQHAYPAAADSPTKLAKPKRKVIVVRRPKQQPSVVPGGDAGNLDDDDNNGLPNGQPSKKTIFVSRKPRPSEAMLFPHLLPGAGQGDCYE